MTPDAKDRKYQFWERNALSVELNTLEMLKQKSWNTFIIIGWKLVYAVCRKNINIQLQGFMKQV